MSGGQIGSVIGAAVGYYFGGPVGAQIGMAVGGYIGGAIDPTKIYGPHVGDGQQQSSTDGTPIAWVQGRARVAGTIVDVSEQREVKKTDSGKGSGTEQVTYELHQDFAILICESSQLRGTTVDGVLRIEMDGKIVYDSDIHSPIHRDSLKFIQGVDFMYGHEDQQPHPTLEAIHGVGNTLAYRGYLVAVFKDFNLTPSGNRIPNFIFTLQASNLNGASYVRYSDAFKYLEAPTPDPGPFPPYAVGYDDSLWRAGYGGFGNSNPDFGGTVYRSQTFPENPVIDGLTYWLRKPFYATPGVSVSVRVIYDDFGDLWVNGHYVTNFGQTSVSTYLIPQEFLEGENMFVYRVHATDPIIAPDNQIFAGLEIFPTAAPPPSTDGTLTLAELVQAICTRGGLDVRYVDVSELYSIIVKGYPIATQCTASECLSPLLAAYFCYASEYDGLIHFRLLGQESEMVINPLDLIESDTGSDGAGVISQVRNLETEYPRKITSTYYDPDQNYQAVTVTYERNSKDVSAIGEQAFQIPIVMTADEAMAATVKALKATWAALEGADEYSLPIIGRGGESYLSIAAGDPLYFKNKRWVAEEVTLGHNVIHLKTTYNRQSAYVTNVQAVPSNPPIPPVTHVGGPTTMYVMNLPSLRTQDQYGVYIAVSGEEAAWRGATVQVSYDDGETWGDALTAIEASVMGTLTTAPLAAGTTFGVDVNGELYTITSGQLAAGGNPWAILSSTDIPEIGQFRVATEDFPGKYTLTEAVRGLKGTTATPHTLGERFTMLNSVYFFPIDLAYGNVELKFRAITLGGSVEDATILSLIYRPDDQVILDGGGAPL